MLKKRICILHAHIPFLYGGAEILVKGLSDNLIRRGFEAEIVQLPYKWYPKNSLFDNLMMWRMLDLSEADGKMIDLVIGTKFPSYGVQHPNKVVWLVHQYRQVYDLFDTPIGLAQTPDALEIKKTVEKFDELALKEAQKIFTISQNVTKRLKNFNQLESDPLYSPPSLAGRYICKDFQNYVLSVGRLDQLKRNDMLIRSLVHCDRKMRVKIAGKGPEAEKLASLAASLGVSERVDFLGFVSDDELIELYANALAVYYAPVDEDYGYTTLEAFLSKKPVITFVDSGGVLEFVKDEENGCVCRPDEEEVASAILKLSSNLTLSRQLGEAGFERVKDISWDNVIDKLTSTL